MKKIGILGYGSVGKFLVDKILNDPKYQDQLELAFVWNRSEDKLADGKLPEKYWLKGNLKEAFKAFVCKVANEVDLVVEVAHPQIAEDCGELILEHCDLMVSSVTTFANDSTEKRLRAAAQKHALYIPTGAGWGVQDIAKMEELGTLKGLDLTMAFNAAALKLKEPLLSKLNDYLADSNDSAPLVIYEGNVREIAKLAPNNVNTMTCLALAAPSIGLDQTKAKLIAQKGHDAHIVTIEAVGPDGFSVKTTRFNPAKKGAVTGAQTYYSFLISLLKAEGKERGVHFC